MLIVWIIGILLFSCQKNDPQIGWDKVPDLIRQITLPTFPNRDYLITDFGAVGDSVTDCFESFKNAINRCNQDGGGRVVVPAGIYLINGPVHLKSNVHLHISEDARLEFSTNPADYLPMVLTRWEGTELFNYSPFIYAYQANNIAISGTGAIDGNAQQSFAQWKPDQKEDKNLLRQMGNDGVPVHERLFGEGHFLRPSMIQPYGCKNVLIEDITIYDSPFWVIHPTFCTNVTVRNVMVDSWNPNNDGVDPDGSVNVLIENCVFNCGDDAVAIKSGRDQDGWRIGQPTENVIIRNCAMNSKANGLCIGSEMSGSVRNVFMENCIVGEAHSTIYFKSNLDRGGIVENVFVRKITVERAITAFIRFESNYKGHRGNHFPPVFRNFNIENVTCKLADHYGLYAVGVEDSPISQVIFKDVTIEKAKIPTFTQYVSDVQLSKVTINDSLISKLSYYEDPNKSDKNITW
jgi:polygalacturonase